MAITPPWRASDSGVCVCVLLCWSYAGGIWPFSFFFFFLLIPRNLIKGTKNQKTFEFHLLGINFGFARTHEDWKNDDGLSDRMNKKIHFHKTTIRLSDILVVLWPKIRLCCSHTAHTATPLIYAKFRWSTAHDRLKLIQLTFVLCTGPKMLATAQHTNTYGAHTTDSFSDALLFYNDHKRTNETMSDWSGR